MIVKKATGSVFPVNTTCISSKDLLDLFVSKTTTINRWRHWKEIIDLKTCIACLDHHGRIYRKDESIQQEPPLHLFCRCVLEPMKAVEHGGAIQDGKNGADYTLLRRVSSPITISPEQKQLLLVGNPVNHLQNMPL